MRKQIKMEKNYLSNIFNNGIIRLSNYYILRDALFACQALKNCLMSKRMFFK